MIRRQLEDYRARQQHIADKLLLQESENATNGKPISVRDFYPDLKLEGPYTSWMATEPIWVQLPYFKNVIVNIEPLKDENLFEERHGFTIEELLKRHKEGRISLVITSNTDAYKDLDYLEPIFDVNPPWHSMRTLAFLEVVSNEVPEVMLQQLANKLPPSSTYDASDLDSFASEFGYTIDNGEYIRIGRILGMAYELTALGYGVFPALLFSVTGKDALFPKFSFHTLKFYNEFLAGPHIVSLNGVHCVRREYYDIAKDVRIAEANIDPFPLDIGRLLCESLLLAPIKDAGDADDIYPNYSKARDALVAIDEIVTHREQFYNYTGEIKDRKEALEKTWNETTSSLKHWPTDESMCKGILSKGYKIGVSTVGYVGASLLSGSIGLSSEPSLLGFAINYAMEKASKKISDFSNTLAEKGAKHTMKLLKPAHVVSIMDIAREWNPAYKKLFS